MNSKHNIYWIDIFIFLFFGVFHTHRIWAFFDREGYVDFWEQILENEVTYLLLLTTLAVLCIIGFIIFLKNYGENPWWRWIYIFGGGYLLFDVFAIYFNLKFWNELIEFMNDVTNPYWNLIWGIFVIIGIFSLILGCYLIHKKNS